MSLLFLLARRWATCNRRSGGDSHRWNGRWLPGLQVGMRSQENSTPCDKEHPPEGLSSSLSDVGKVLEAVRVGREAAA